VPVTAALTALEAVAVLSTAGAGALLRASCCARHKCGMSASAAAQRSLEFFIRMSIPARGPRKKAELQLACRRAIGNKESSFQQAVTATRGKTPLSPPAKPTPELPRSAAKAKRLRPVCREFPAFGAQWTYSFLPHGVNPRAGKPPEPDRWHRKQQ